MMRGASEILLQEMIILAEKLDTGYVSACEKIRNKFDIWSFLYDFGLENAEIRQITEYIQGMQAETCRELFAAGVTFWQRLHCPED